MKNIDQALTATARQAVLAHGFDQILADLVDVIRHPAAHGDPEHAEIRWSHPVLRKGKQRQEELALSYAPTDTLTDRLSADSIADVVIAIRPTLPASLRDVPIPAWAIVRGDRIRGAMGKARALTQKAIPERIAA